VALAPRREHLVLGHPDPDAREALAGRERSSRRWLCGGRERHEERDRPKEDGGG
jgi:hypothetical protein